MRPACFALAVLATPAAAVPFEISESYAPSTEPGCRLPHGWLIRNGQRISSLDLIGLTATTVIAGPTAEVVGNCLQVGRDFDDPDNWWGTVLGLPDDAYITVRPDQHIA